MMGAAAAPLGAVDGECAVAVVNPLKAAEQTGHTAVLFVTVGSIV